MVGLVGRNQNVNANLNVNNNAPPLTPDGKVDYSESFKSITSDSLFDAMQGRPKPDIKIFGKVVFPASTDFKNVANDLDRFKEAFNDLSQRPIESLTKRQIDSLKHDLDTAIMHAGDYQNTHQNNPDKLDRRNVMENLKSDLEKQKGFLDALLTAKDNFPKGATIGNAHAMLKSDVETGSLVTNPHRDDRLQGKPQAIGSGAMNTVYLATWIKPDNSVERTVLKPLSVDLPEGANGADLANTIGIPNEHQMVAERNVATGKVAARLGLQDMAPTGNIIVLNGQTCLEMPVAPGSAPMLYVDLPIPQDDPRTNQARELEKTQKGREQLERANIFKSGVDNDGKSLFAIKEQTFYDFPFASSQPNDVTSGLQEGLLNLQVIDLLTGQVDRNPNNIFIKVENGTVTVTGIDHDISFGENEGKNETDLTPDDGFPPPQWKGLPPLMMEDTYRSLMNIDRVAYQTDLETSGLTEKQVSLAMDRFDGLRRHARDLNDKGLVVNDLSLNVTDPNTDEQVSVSEFLTSRPYESYVGGLNRLQQLTLDAKVPLSPMN